MSIVNGSHSFLARYGCFNASFADIRFSGSKSSMASNKLRASMGIVLETPSAGETWCEFNGSLLIIRIKQNKHTFGGAGECPKIPSGQSAKYSVQKKTSYSIWLFF